MITKYKLEPENCMEYNVVIANVGDGCELQVTVEVQRSDARLVVEAVLVQVEVLSSKGNRRVIRCQDWRLKIHHKTARCHESSHLCRSEKRLTITL